MRRDNSGTMGTGYLKFSNFKKFIDRHSFIKHIELSNSGEMFLNPDIVKIIKYAYEKGVILHADNGVNLNTISEDACEALVKYEFNSFVVSLDGATQTIYSAYRRNGNFDTVIDNIKKINSYKEKYNTQYPNMTWQYVLMEHNECDVIKAKQMAADLNMGIYFKLTWDPGYKPHDTEMLQRETGLQFFSTEDLAANTGEVYCYETCYQMWREPQINWDGRLLGCCWVYKDDYQVNVFEVGLKSALKSKYFSFAKKLVRGLVVPNGNEKHIPCLNCSLYLNMVKTGTYVQLRELSL